MSDIEQPIEQPVDESSSDWKRDTIWNYLNFVLVGISIFITVGLALWLNFLNKPVKALTCDVITVGPLVSVEDDVSNRVQVVFDHVPVPNVKFAVIKIANPGNVPIDKADFERPLFLRFGGQGKSKILSAQLLNSHPSNIGATYKISGDTVTLKPLLLNPDDNIILKVIYTGQGESMNLDARIVGVSEVTGTDPAREQKAVLINSLKFALIMTILGTLIAWVVIAGGIRRHQEKLCNDPEYFRKFLTGMDLRLSDEDINIMQQMMRYRAKKRQDTLKK